MIKPYFENLQDVVFEQLNQTKRSLKIAMAWLNFDIYKSTFENLLEKGVNIQIVLDNNKYHQKYLDIIQYLNQKGAIIKLINWGGTMHHKFCIIDEHICMSGSFNWTINANINNVENLNLCDDSKFVYQHLLEFKSLWDLDSNDITILKKPILCDKCNSPKINILFMVEQEPYYTKIIILQLCNCQQNIIFEDYFDISVYYNLESIYENYSNLYDEYRNQDDMESIKELEVKTDYDIAKYLSSVRQNRMGLPIIHAVGIRAYEMFEHHNDLEPYYKIIWKERYCSAYIHDEYPIMEDII